MVTRSKYGNDAFLAHDVDGESFDSTHLCTALSDDVLIISPRILLEQYADTAGLDTVTYDKKCGTITGTELSMTRFVGRALSMDNAGFDSILDDAAALQENHSGSPKWARDLEMGKLAELYVANVMRGVISGTVEVKYDRRLSETKNLFIEYARGSDKDFLTTIPTGITATTSDWWVVVLTNGVCVVIRTEVLINHLRATPYRCASSCSRGSVTLGKVVPIVGLLTSLLQ